MEDLLPLYRRYGSPIAVNYLLCIYKVRGVRSAHLVARGLRILDRALCEYCGKAEEGRQGLAILCTHNPRQLELRRRVRSTHRARRGVARWAVGPNFAAFHACRLTVTIGVYRFSCSAH
jgi:hypothetical protein